jgi:hypothetical protein
MVAPLETLRKKSGIKPGDALGGTTRPNTPTTVEALLQEPTSLFVAPKNPLRTPGTYSMPSGDE